MHKIKDILRLHLLGGVASCRRIGLAVGCSKSAVSECLRRAGAAGLTCWQDVAELDEEALEQRLYPGQASRRARSQRALPDWARIREELARRLAARGWGIRKLDVRRVSLEALFTGVVLRRREQPALPAA